MAVKAIESFSGALELGDLIGQGWEFGVPHLINVFNGPGVFLDSRKDASPLVIYRFCYFCRLALRRLIVALRRLSTTA